MSVLFNQTEDFEELNYYASVRFYPIEKIMNFPGNTTIFILVVDRPIRYLYLKQGVYADHMKLSGSDKRINMFCYKMNVRSEGSW